MRVKNVIDGKGLPLSSIRFDFIMFEYTQCTRLGLSTDYHLNIVYSKICI